MKDQMKKKKEEKENEEKKKKIDKEFEDRGEDSVFVK